jgi:IclR family transcriptional regulator, KDG regulon repressor
MDARIHGIMNTIQKGFSLDFELDNLIAHNERKMPEAKSIRSAAIVLSCISNGINTVGEMEDYTAISRATIYRLLRGLEKSYLVIHDPINRKYYLGALIRRLVSNPMVTHEYLINYAKQEMYRLSGITGETINLSIKIGLTHTTVFSVPSSYELRLVQQTHHVGPLYKGSGGKVLLAQLEDKELRDVIQNIQFELSGRSEKDDLLEEINNIRQRGYCITSGEVIQWATSFAAPLRGYEVPAAIAILGIEPRMLPKKDLLVECLLKSTDTISRILLNNKKIPSM